MFAHGWRWALARGYNHAHLALHLADAYLERTMKRAHRFVVCLLLFLGALCSTTSAAEQLQIALFDVDVSPPVGSPLAYDTTTGVQGPLSCRGAILLGSGKPIVLVAVDWIGIGNGSHRVFREQIAKAAGTDADRVSLHTLHQHDAPWADHLSAELAAQHDIGGYVPFDTVFARESFTRVAEAAEKAKQNAQPITHVGLASAKVEKVASNRRILGDNGKVKHVRYTATRDPNIRAYPEGVIDPLLRMIAFYNGDKPVAVFTYYATHPQSYYRTGKANPDFPGMARNARQEATGVPHIHFNGAGGNIGAGKYNNGSPENRQVLADRVSDAMQRAWKSLQRSPITSDDVAWTTLPVKLPPGKHLVEADLVATLTSKDAPPPKKLTAATQLAWLRRCKAEEAIDVGCLSLGKARVLHLPGELFVEYQLAAQELRDDLFVAMAAYGDYSPAYIGTAVAYGQGGYETGPTASYVAPEVEGVLMTAIAKLLEADTSKIKPLGTTQAAGE